MKVYVVETLYRNKCDFDCFTEVFSTEEKAKKYMEEDFRGMCIDFGINEDCKEVTKSHDYIIYDHRDYDYDFFEIQLHEMEVI